MYYVKKRLEISGSHRLILNYQSKCQNLHGHNWIITVYCKNKELNVNGMVVDFALIKEVITDAFDHKNFNSVYPFTKINPTAENMAKYFCSQIPYCYKVEVQESEGNIAVYEKDDE